jgi:phosphoglycerate dehydrogenase-like enzyme
MRILIDLPSYVPALPALKNLPGIEVEWVEKPEEKVRTLPTKQIKDCEMLFCMFPPQNHAEMSTLKLIQIALAGYKQLVGHKFEERGIRVCNALGVFDVHIGEWNVAMMVNLARDLRGLIRHQESQVGDRSARFQEEIRDRVVGLWGYGGIGRETARLAKSLGMKVHVLSRGSVQPR